MDSKATRIALIHHQLLGCSADIKIKPDKSPGGTVEFISTLEAPDDKTVIKKGDSYLIYVVLDCTGKANDSKDVAFHVSCKMEGLCAVVSGSDAGIKSSPDLWYTPANQLFPLVAQFASDLVSRMGYKNVIIPSSMPDIPMPVNLKSGSVKKTRKS